MSIALYSNNAESITAAAILAADLTITVATGDGAKFPALAVNQHAIVTLTDGVNYEIVRVTANIADTLTVVRAQEGTSAIDWAAGATVSQRLTAGAFQSLLDLQGAGTSGTQAGVNSIAGGANAVAIGNNCATTQSSSVVMGRNCSVTRSRTVAVGHGATVTANRGVAFGYNATTNDVRGVAIGIDTTAGYYATSLGRRAVATGNYAVALGTEATATASRSTAIGYNSNASATSSTAVGKAAAATASSSVAIGLSAQGRGISSIAIGVLSDSHLGLHNICVGGKAKQKLITADNSISLGYKAYCSGTEAIAIGNLAKAYALNSVAVGAGALNTLSYSTMIQGGITIRSSFASTKPQHDFAGVEVVLMTESMPLAVLGSKDIILPTGAVFLTTGAGILVTNQTGIITTQATVEASISVDGITFAPLSPAALTTTLTGARKFEQIASGSFSDAATHLRASVTAAAVSTLLYDARFYFKGIMVQE